MCCCGTVWGFCFAVLPLFFGVAVSARNWIPDTQSSAARSASPVQVCFLQCVNFRSLSAALVVGVRLAVPYSFLSRNQTRGYGKPYPYNQTQFPNRGLKSPILVCSGDFTSPRPSGAKSPLHASQHPVKAGDPQGIGWYTSAGRCLVQSAAAHRLRISGKIVSG